VVEVVKSLQSDARYLRMMLAEILAMTKGKPAVPRGILEIVGGRRRPSSLKDSG